MAKRKDEKLDALIFIDTNIFLDFYRIRRSDVSMRYLQEIEKNKDIIIASSQVEMEFKKNRQEVILESMIEVKKNVNINLSVPAILSDAKVVDMIKKSKKGIEDQQKRLRQQIERILKYPNKYDPVFKSLQKLFRYDSTINLNRDNKIRFAIRKLAMKRFLLGYPPRKKTDNSFGDAINWEWILSCAINSGKHIIIVTRDCDYGSIYEGESYINDWLYQEFKQRVSQKRKLILTDKLSSAFKLVEIKVTKDMINEEEKIISKYDLMDAMRTFQEAVRIRNESFHLEDLQDTIEKIKQNLWVSDSVFNLQKRLKDITGGNDKTEKE